MGVLPESDVGASLVIDGLRLDLDGPGGEAVLFAGDIFGDADNYNIGDDFQHPEMDAGNGSEGEDLHDNDLTAALHAALEDEWTNGNQNDWLGSLPILLLRANLLLRKLSLGLIINLTLPGVQRTHCSMHITSKLFDIQTNTQQSEQEGR